MIRELERLNRGTNGARLENRVVVVEPEAGLREGTDVGVEPVAEVEIAAESAREVVQLPKGLLGFLGVVREDPTFC